MFIEIVFKATNFEQLKKILEWIKEEEIEKKHPNTNIRIGVGAANLP